MIVVNSLLIKLERIRDYAFTLDQSKGELNLESAISALNNSFNKNNDVDESTTLTYE